MKLSIICSIALAAYACSSAQAGWVQAQSVDRLDGSVSHELRLDAENTKISQHRQTPKTDRTAQILVSCDPKNVAMVVGVSGQLIAGSKSTVSYRVDQQKPVVSKGWDAASSSDSIGVWGKKGVTVVLEQWAKGKELFIRIEHDVFGTTEATFNLDGTPEALALLKKSCRF